MRTRVLVVLQKLWIGLFVVTEFTVALYDRIGIARSILRGSRYERIRPRDGIALLYLTIAFVSVGIPIAALLAFSGVIAVQTLLFVAALLFIAPPTLATMYSEFLLIVNKSGKE
jgi:hypothetical protein